MDYVSLLGFANPASSWTHLAAAFAALAGGVALFRRGRGSTIRLIALFAYTFSLIFLFSMSGVFHLLSEGPAREVLQRLDHAGIWVLIAGSFTPIHVILFRGAWRWSILSLIWTVAITGLVLEVVFFKAFPESLILTLFLGLGWCGALTGFHFRRTFHGESLTLLVLGGAFYSFGAVIDYIRAPVIWPGYFGAHEIFHVFVVLGAWCHWRFIYDWADHPVANTLHVHVRIFPNSVFIGESIGDQLHVEAQSLGELKAQLKKIIRERYHESIVPNIHLKYSQEETISSKEVRSPV